MPSASTNWLEQCPVATDLVAADGPEAISQVGGQWRGVNALAGATEELVSAMLARERVASTALPTGIAIPHARSPRVTEVVAALGKFAQPVDFAGTPVWLVVALISPPTDPRAHLESLSWLARRAADAAVVRALRAAGTASEIRRALCQA